MGGEVSLAIPATLLCTLVLVTSSGFLQPFARSYNGRDWQTTAGPFSNGTFACSSGAWCTTTLMSARYELTMFDAPPYSSADEAARFLEQATFGTTQSGVEALLNHSSNDLRLAMADWVQQQVTMSTTSSHRARFRRLLNARFEVPTNTLGAVTHPCQAGTRYRRFAFTEKDWYRTVTISTDTSTGMRVMSVDGFVRTVTSYIQYETSFDDFILRNLPDGSYRICYVEPIIHGWMAIDTPDAECVGIFTAADYRGNPIVSFGGTDQPNVLVNIISGQAMPIDTRYFQEEDITVQEIIVMSSLTDATCATIGTTGNPVNPVFAMYNGVVWIHDPRFDLLQNTVTQPAPDGGGRVVQETRNFNRASRSATCANAPRTFLNEEGCFLSSDPNTCAVSRGMEEELPEFYITMNAQTIRTIYEVTGNGGLGTKYFYVVDGLRIEDDRSVERPCSPFAVSRWVNVTCSGLPLTVGSMTAGWFGQLLSEYKLENENQYIVDIDVGGDVTCNLEDIGKVGFEVVDLEGICWRNVHPDLMNVYDFTLWTEIHDGNSPTRNPIKEFGDGGNVTLVFPWWHEMNRWQMRKQFFGTPIKFGDEFNFFTLEEDVRTREVIAAFGVDVEDTGVRKTFSADRLVCGSPNEIQNNPSLGGGAGKGAFDAFTSEDFTTWVEVLNNQKKTIWTEIALTAPDQLRQRIAWALAQILVISEAPIEEGVYLTEIFVAYYDIFVRHAFGSYRDVLKEVSYNPLMADMLTFYGSRSTAFVWMTEGKLEYADENYAREIMQLFTTGLFRLTLDGNKIVGNENEALRIYTNDDIEEYARVWTGFESHPSRGNFEEGIVDLNRIDPMRIIEEYRDRFPKMGLNRTYIGDGYPLCADLPSRHFLKKGATYRLLGNTSLPELQRDSPLWESNPAAVHFTLQSNGPQSLFAILCDPDVSGNCRFAPKIVLDQNLACSGTECMVETVRTIEVMSGIFYEYVRPPCVHQAFFNNAKVVVNREEYESILCADPRTESASVACCNDFTEVASWDDVYFGERTSFQTALDRCGNQLCDLEFRPDCGGDYPPCADNHRYWTNTPCTLRAKVDNNGKIGIVHLPGVEEINLTSGLVAEDTKTFFRVDWTGDYTILTSDCVGVSACTPTIDGMCMCDVTVMDSQVYVDGDTPTRDNILDSLPIGAFNPDILGTGFSQTIVNNVTIYTQGGSYSINTIFKVTDDFGVVHFRKNIRSVVQVINTAMSFRNPVHFMSLADPEVRDAHYETDAALDHYFYHPNTAPFLAFRFAQRFGISNPSPEYIKAIATAFRTGTHSFVSNGGTTIAFGTGEYGSLASTIACVLLHDEARSVALDADPTFGSLKEPLIKLVGLMRTMEFRLYENTPYVAFGVTVGSRIGEMAHELPNVFSFFLPEYSPSGTVAQADLVAPEAQVMTGPRMIDTLNGLMALVKYGLSHCQGGFGAQLFDNYWFDCESYEAGEFEASFGSLTFTPAIMTPQAVVRQLATLLTSGRLSTQSRELLEDVYTAEPNPTLALVKTQQLLVTTPEFHSTNLVRRTGQDRPALTAPPASDRPYKALVYILLDGGVDSFNMLAPHTCAIVSPASGQTLLEQYYAERTTIAMTDAERSRVIGAAGQPCSEFAIHQNLEIVERLYNEGDLAFFANAGVINTPVTQDDYYDVTRTELFAHNTMQEEAQRIDPYETAPGTGILGRMCDVLVDQGYNAQPITVDDSSLATVGVPGQAVDPLFVSQLGATEFNPRPQGETFDPRPFVKTLNGATKLQSSLLGETWSARLERALGNNELIIQALNSTQLTQTFANTDHSQKLKTIATLIASHQQRGTDRDVFFVNLGNWDHHFQLKTNLVLKFQELNQALTTFTDEMKSMGLWNNVTLAITSDFARTLTANSGEGSDHAWGGNYFVMGGDVRGGQIHGQYPADITEAGPLNIGRGRLIPTMSWESIITSFSGWMGLQTPAEFDYIMPNRLRTGTKLFTKEEVFHNSL